MNEPAPVPLPNPLREKGALSPLDAIAELRAPEGDAPDQITPEGDRLPPAELPDPAEAETETEAPEEAADEDTDAELDATQDDSAEAAEGGEDKAEAESEEEDAPDDLEDEDSLVIDPPRSWKSRVDQETWDGLPGEVQQMLAERENERDNATNGKLREAEDASKQAQAERAEASQQRQAMSQQLEMIAPMIQAAIGMDFPDVQTQQDLLYLRQNDPERYAQYKDRYDVLQYTQSQQEALKAQAAEDAKKAQVERYQQAEVKLVEHFPQWGEDPEQGKREIVEIQDYLIEQFNVPKEMLGQMIEPWMYEIVQDSMRFKRAQKAADKAKVKRKPKVKKPAATQTKGDREVASRTAKLKNLGQQPRDQALKNAASLLRTG